MNLHVNKAEHLCLCSASGKGKSTLLKLIQGYVIPQSGELIIDNLHLDKSNIKQIRNKIVWIPQNINFPVSTGLELIKMMEMEKATMQIHQYIEQLELKSSILAQNFTEISGGQKQRIVISICLSLNRPIILLDEPTASLDPKNTKNLANIIASFKEKTIISASHDIYWQKTADRLLDLESGVF